jgi:hypothetical protein
MWSRVATLLKWARSGKASNPRMQLGKLDVSRAYQRLSCKTPRIGPKQHQRVTARKQNAGLRKLFLLLIALASIAFGAYSPASAQVGGLGFPGPGPRVSSGGGGCSQATALLARMGGGQNASAVTTLICGMVTDGTWSLMDVFYVFAINSTGNAALNWVSSSFSITVNGSCTFTANQGYTGDASSCYLATAYNPATSGTNYVQNSASLGVCNFNASANAETLIGANDATSNYASMGFSSSAMFYDVNDNAFPSFTFVNTAGLWHADRTGSATMALYLNGNSVNTSTASSTAIPSFALDILAQNEQGTPLNFSTGQVGVAFAGAGLTSGQANSVFSRIHTYLGAVGAPSGC